MGEGHGYKVGTPWIPNDQIALLHKGEAVVPKDQNPYNKGGSFTPISSASSMGGSDEIVQVLKWGFEYLAKKLDDNAPSDTQPTAVASPARNFTTGDVFRLGGMSI